MFDFLERLREKSEHERLVISIVTALVITGGIFFIWLGSAFTQSSNTEDQIRGEKKVIEKSPASNFTEDLGALFNRAGEATKDFRESFGDSSKTIYERGVDAEKEEIEEENSTESLDEILKNE